MLVKENKIINNNQYAYIYSDMNFYICNEKDVQKTKLFENVCIPYEKSLSVNYIETDIKIEHEDPPSEMEIE